jgi:CRISPR/Cas system CSM-associated protein Csm2 small subunit
MEFILTMLSAFLGGAFALVGQWYVFRNERYSNRRNVLYYLLEIYGNVYRLERLKSADKFFDKLMYKLGVEMSDSEMAKPFLQKLLWENLFEDVLDELDNHGEKYPEIVNELSKENPTLAYYISHHAKSLEKMIDYLDSISESIKKEIPINDHNTMDEFFGAIFQNNLITSSHKDIRSSIEEVASSISILESRRVRVVLKNIEESISMEKEMDELVNAILTISKAQSNS